MHTYSQAATNPLQSHPLWRPEKQQNPKISESPLEKSPNVTPNDAACFTNWSSGRSSCSSTPQKVGIPSTASL
ncbi:hypothetical protein [Rubritalea tangerina]|uniref:hypothetical protein n=1 Tax=Rubritalea tangerina TaxID=430798 RepID=UPI0036148625